MIVLIMYVILMTDLYTLSYYFSKWQKSSLSPSSSIFITTYSQLYQHKQYDTATIDHVSVNNKITSLINSIHYVPKKRLKVS